MEGSERTRRHYARNVAVPARRRMNHDVPYVSSFKTSSSFPPHLPGRTLTI